jgi:hypothetical protein
MIDVVERVIERHQEVKNEGISEHAEAFAMHIKVIDEGILEDKEGNGSTSGPFGTLIPKHSSGMAQPRTPSSRRLESRIRPFAELLLRVSKEV